MISLKGLCASELLFDVICSSRVSLTYVQQSENKLICSFNTTDDCRFNFAQIIPEIPQPSARLKNLINEQIRGKQKISLAFIDVFSQQCIQLFDTEKQKLQDKDIAGISDESLQFDKYKERALGCQMKCPCCGRMCDVEHFKVKTTIGSVTNKHQCKRGHQFRAMIGFKVERSNEPSFRMCESMRDIDKIVHLGKYISWEEYKKQYPTWSFDVDFKQDANESRARLVFTWTKIGRELCRHFGMKYTSRAIDSSKISDHPIHFVLVLDDSCSMTSLLWQALINSITIFMQIRSNEANPEDRLTIILYSDEASIEVFGQQIHPSIVCQMKSKYHGGTNFSAALQRVIQTMSDARKAADHCKFGIVFMSDGVASYPGAELTEIKNNWFDQIYKFWCIGFGEEASHFQVLRDMCTFVNGDDRGFTNPKDKTALETVYAEIARGEDHVKTQKLKRLVSSLDNQSIKKKLMALKIDDEDDLHAKLIHAVLNKGIAEGLSECSENISPSKLRQLGESLRYLDSGDTDESPSNGRLTKYQIDQLISAKLIEMKVDEEDDLHARIIDSVWSKGVVASLGEHKENIAPIKFRALLDMLKPLQEQIDSRQILDMLVRLKIDNEEGALHDKIVDAVLKNGAHAINRFSDVISRNRFAQLVNKLNEKFPMKKSAEESSSNCVLSLASKIDSNLFNALDDLSENSHFDFHNAVDKSFDQLNFVELITRRMIYLIKRQQDLRRFIEDLHANVAASEAISLRQLLCSFLLNCTEDVRIKCYQLLSASNPVPLITYQGGECFAAESYWIGMGDESIGGVSGLSTTTRILSCGLESTCKGKSKLLNTLFFTSFEENEYDNNRFFDATIDMQMVRNYGSPGNHLCIADAHGVISEVLLLKMAGAFDAIFVHLNESSCNLVKYIELIGKLASRVHKCIFVFVRDSKIDSSDECCNQEKIKSTYRLNKLGDLVGSVNGPRIKVFRVPSLVKKNQLRFFESTLRVFLFDELFSITNKNEVNLL